MKQNNDVNKNSYSNEKLEEVETVDSRQLELVTDEEDLTLFAKYCPHGHTILTVL